MVALQSEIKRGFLRSLARTAADSATLHQALEAFQDKGFAGLQSGKIIVGTSGAGHSVSFDAPAIGKQFTQEQVFALSELFLNIYDDSLAVLGLAYKPDNSQDATIFTQMLRDDRLAGARQEMNDYTALRYGYGWNAAT